MWGAGDERPEGLLFERGRKEPRLAVDVPGSVETVALDASGTRLVLATRERHANLFSQSGGLELHDTGERDLVLRSEVRAGGELDAVYRLADQGRTVFFVAGFPLASPEDLWGGESWLDRRRRLVFFRGVRETPERVAGRLLIPARHELIGRSLGLQAATFGPEGARLADAHLRFLVL